MAKYLAENGVSGTFWKSYRPNSFHTWHLPLWDESLDPYSFTCSQSHFRPSGGQIFGWKWGFWNFLKKTLAQFISYLAFTLMGWVSWPLFLFGYFWMRWVLIRAGVYCPHLWAQLVAIWIWQKPDYHHCQLCLLVYINMILLRCVAVDQAERWQLLPYSCVMILGISWEQPGRASSWDERLLCLFGSLALM